MEFKTAKTQMLGKCKYCKKFSMVSDMVIGEDNKPYHNLCKERADKCESSSEGNVETTKAGESQQ